HVVLGDVERREAEPVLLEIALRPALEELATPLLRVGRVAVEVVLRQHEAAVVRVRELVPHVFRWALTVLAPLDERDAAEVAFERTPAGRDDRRVLVAVLVAQPLAVGLDVLQLLQRRRTAL